MIPHDAPNAVELVESVREWLERDVLAQTTGRLQFHARVAAKVLAIVERELTSGESMALAHESRLQTLGVADDAELASAIRSGALDDRFEEVRELVRLSVLDKLAVANPGYVAEP